MPTTFVDDAELVWRLAESRTQQQTAEVMGWSRERVKDFNALKKICPDAWQMIGATVGNTAPDSNEFVAPENGAVAPFSERLLRNILELTPAQQLELVTEVAEGTITKERIFVVFDS